MSGDFDHMAYSGEKEVAYQVQSNGERAKGRTEGVVKTSQMHVYAKQVIKSYRAVLGCHSGSLLRRAYPRRCQSRLAERIKHGSPTPKLISACCIGLQITVYRTRIERRVTLFVLTSGGTD